MEQPLYLYNTLTRRKEEFIPINPPHVGLYACGPTVYGEAHLGHARQAITYDLLFRYLEHLGYKVRYVRNITDVGHLENDADEGEDKIAKKARLEALEPMEIAQTYTNRYHEDMDRLNVLRPNIEPRATGHIIEQQQMIERILANGFAYEVDGSVYFDVEAFNEKHSYGQLSGRVLDELKNTSRALAGQQQKKNAFDFALWKKASPEHIMRWPSPWGDGFPGWHLECSAMSMKYLGEEFDIHGGGMDLIFPHHECEIAQSVATTGKPAVRYWVHNNMITIDGQKMAKSLGNFITLKELFSGNHPKLKQPYHPMVVRFFILQAHYRGTIDFSNQALQAAEKGFRRLMEALVTLENLKAGGQSAFDVAAWQQQCAKALNDDMNTPILIANLFDAVKLINSIHTGQATLTAEDLAKLKQLFPAYIVNILGLRPIEEQQQSNATFDQLVDLMLNLRLEAKARKDYATADKIRNELQALGFEIRDKKDGFEWELLT